MSEDIPRSIRFPKNLWDAIDADAQRCKRSSVKQLEAVLTAYYQLDDTELNQNQLEFVGELFSHGKKKMPLIEADDKKKKRA